MIVVEQILYPLPDVLLYQCGLQKPDKVNYHWGGIFSPSGEPGIDPNELQYIQDVMSTLAQHVPDGLRTGRA